MSVLKVGCMFAFFWKKKGGFRPPLYFKTGHSPRNNVQIHEACGVHFSAKPQEESPEKIKERGDSGRQEKNKKNKKQTMSLCCYKITPIHEVLLILLLLGPAAPKRDQICGMVSYIRVCP